MKICGTVRRETLATPAIPSATASYDEDKVRILEGISGAEGGVAGFDTIVSANINKELPALRGS